MVTEIQKPQMSPVFLGSTILTPLRYYFSHYAGADLKWDSEYDKTKIDISSAFDINKKTSEFKPRILVARGGYVVSTTGLTDNLAESEQMVNTYGLTKAKYLLLTSGECTLKIQAWQEGTCQRIADHLHHFISWTSHLLCNTQGFKKFGFPLQVSDIGLNKEDKEIFEIMVSIPWTKEEMWTIENDANKISNILVQFSKLEQSIPL